MLFLPCLKLNVHLYLSKFKGFLSSQHVVKDTLMKMMEVGLLSSVSPPRRYAVGRINGQASTVHSIEKQRSTDGG